MRAPQFALTGIHSQRRELLFCDVDKLLVALRSGLLQEQPPDLQQAVQISLPLRAVKLIHSPELKAAHTQIIQSFYGADFCRERLCYGMILLKPLQRLARAAEGSANIAEPVIADREIPACFRTG